MNRVARYFKICLILVFVLSCLLVGRHNLAKDTGATTGIRQLRGRGASRFNDSKTDIYRMSTFTPECRKLSREGNYAKWFNEMFDPLLSPIWTANISIPSEVFDWWNNLVFNKSQPYEKVTSLVKELALNPDPFLGNRPRDCIMCAVVGNSGNLRKSGYGKMIDDHDIIIRMNKCPTVGYEKDVGSRTTHYIAYPQSFKEASLRNALFVLAAFCYGDVKWLHQKLVDQSKRDTQTGNTGPFDKNKIFIQNPEVMWQIKHKWGLGRGKYPSTGVLSVFFALLICDKVNAFGFGATSKGNWDHYFSKDDGKRNSAFRSTLVHDSAAEELLLQKLIEVKRITMYRGVR